MSVSAWGVDHGGEVSKADSMNTKRRNHKLASGALGTLNPAFGAAHGAVTAKPGKRAKSAVVAGGGALAGGMVGGVAGAKFGVPGQAVGGIAGSLAGGALGAQRNQNKGRVVGIKPKKKI